MANLEWVSDSDSDYQSDLENETVPLGPRKLTNDEIADMVNSIAFCHDQTAVQQNVLSIHREKLRRKLSEVTIKPEKIPELKKIILTQFHKSVINPGEAVGVNAAQNIGEPTTQLSVIRTEQILVYSKNGSFYRGEIGNFVDSIMKEKEIKNLGQGSEVVYFSDTEYFVLTVNPETEKCDWKPLCEVSRHPANGQLLKVTTKSGRETTTTLSHSHLQRTSNGKIVPKVAADLKVGDFIPVARHIPHCEHCDNYDVNYLLADCERVPAWVYFSQLSFIRHLLVSYIESAAGKYDRITSTNNLFLQDLSILFGFFDIFTEFSNQRLILHFAEKKLFTDQIKNKKVFWDEIAKIEILPDPNELVYDLGVADNHTFAVNAGILVHNTLNSVVFESQIAIKENNKITVLDIGEFVETAILTACENDTTFYPETGTTFTKLNKWIEIESIDESGKISQKQIEAVTRHPVVNADGSNTVVKVNTEHGRTVTATLGDSFLGLRDGKIVPVYGRDLTLKDSLIVKENEGYALDKIANIELLPCPTDYVYDLTVADTRTFVLYNGLCMNDTFHKSGQRDANVTLGFPRAKELFNATKSPANPTCTMYFTRNNNNPSELHSIIDKLPKVLIDNLLSSYHIYDPEEYVDKQDFWHEIWLVKEGWPDITNDEWCLRLKFNVEKLYEHDITVRKIARKLEKTFQDIRCIPSPLNLGIVDVLIDCTEVPDDDFEEPLSETSEDHSSNESNESNESEEETNEMEKCSSRRYYMEKIISLKIRGHHVHGINGIHDVYRRKIDSTDPICGTHLRPEIAKRLQKRNCGEEWIVDTDGTNLSEIFSVPGVDTTRTFSNDMWEIVNLLGIEAARIYLLHEFMNIVNSGGASINPIHIYILVAKMTYTGTIRAIARFGVETSQYDPIARATFEEVVSQLCTSAVFSETDHLSGISSNIVLGTRIRAGTGLVTLTDRPVKINAKPMPRVAVKGHVKGKIEAPKSNV